MFVAQIYCNLALRCKRQLSLIFATSFHCLQFVVHVYATRNASVIEHLKKDSWLCCVVVATTANNSFNLIWKVSHSRYLLTSQLFVFYIFKNEKVMTFKNLWIWAFSKKLSVYFVHETLRNDGPETFQFSYSNAHNFFYIFNAIATKLGMQSFRCLSA